MKTNIVFVLVKILQIKLSSDLYQSYPMGEHVCSIHTVWLSRWVHLHDCGAAASHQRVLADVGNEAPHHDVTTKRELNGVEQGGGNPLRAG